MRIGLVTPYSWSVPGGVNDHVEHLAAELEGRGHHCWIMAPSGAGIMGRRLDSRRHLDFERFIPMGSAVGIPVNGSKAYINTSPRAVIRMDRAIRDGRFDVLHVHEPSAPSVSMAAVLLAASPVVGTFHAALSGATGYDAVQWVHKIVIDHLDVRIAVSEAALEYPERRFPGDYRIIPNGVAVERYRSARNGVKVPGRVLFIGRAEKRKGLDVLLEAFARLRLRMPHATLTIAGADRREVMLVASRNGTGFPVDLTGVQALGWVRQERKVELLAEAEVACMPSLSGESFGIVLSEAMASGVPVVASDLAGYRAVLRGGEAGRLVPVGDPVAMADALADVLADADLRRRMSTAGIAAAEDLAWSHVADEVFQAYEDAIAKPMPRGRHGLPGRPWFGQAWAEYYLETKLGMNVGSRSSKRQAAEAARAAAEQVRAQRAKA